jgi:hypothetical protein
LHRRRGRPWRLRRGSGASQEVVGLCWAAQLEEDEGRQGPALRGRRGARGGGSGEGEVSRAAWASRRAKARGVGGLAGLEKKRKRISIRN